MGNLKTNKLELFIIFFKIKDNFDSNRSRKVAKKEP